MKQSVTPLNDFLTEFIKADISRLFMPGHKGNHPYEVLREISRYDITEITGADSLYEADGIIMESEKIASELFETASTAFSAGGSTLCIQTMLSLVTSPGDSVIAARNAHISFFNSCVLLDLTPSWILPKYNDEFGVSGIITAEQVLKAIVANKNAKAVYITSPDYMGAMSDIKGIAEVCKSYGMPLLVDNAHGAHLKLLREDCHPIKLGATLCCDSAHKTLPTLTGAAYLHSSDGERFGSEIMKKNMALFGSTSPSYLIMLSLDLCNRYLLSDAKTDFLMLCDREAEIWDKLNKKGFTRISNRCDPTKITLDGAQAGKNGNELFEHFKKHKIEPEYVGERHMVFMLSPQTTERDFLRFTEAIEAFVPSVQKENTKIQPFLPSSAMSMRKAFFSQKETLPLDSAVGRTSASTRIKCPPGIPIIAPGELVDEQVEKLLKKSSIFALDVVK